MREKVIVTAAIFFIAVLFIKVASQIPKIVFYAVRGISFIFGLITIIKNWDTTYQIIKSIYMFCSEKSVLLINWLYYIVTNSAERMVNEFPKIIN